MFQSWFTLPDAVVYTTPSPGWQMNPAPEGTATFADMPPPTPTAFVAGGNPRRVVPTVVTVGLPTRTWTTGLGSVVRNLFTALAAIKVPALAAVVLKMFIDEVTEVAPEVPGVR